MEIQHMSKEGFEKMQERLNFLVTEKRRECQRDLETARAHGDLSENAEYDAAKEKLNNNEREIKELSDKMSSARILDDSKIAKDKAFLGATITLKDNSDNEVADYLLVSSLESDILANKLSVAAPLGKALLGHSKGDTVEVKAPNGKAMKYTILKIRRD